MFGRKKKTEGPVDAPIEKFIGEHHVLTLATVSPEGPYCCNIFYARNAAENIFVFASAADTRHAAEMIANGFVAASILLETKVVGQVRGLQIQGRVTRAANDPLGAKARSLYLGRYPYAAAMPLELWVFRPTWMKLTDNRLGFGKKIIWNESER